MLEGVGGTVDQDLRPFRLFMFRGSHEKENLKNPGQALLLGSSSALRAQTAIGCEYPVKAREVHARFRNEGGQTRDEI